MARRLFRATRALLHVRDRPPIPASSAAAAAAASLLPLLPCKRRKKLLKKLNSPRVTPIEPDAARRVPALDAVLDRDAAFRFLTSASSFLVSLPPPHGIPHSEAGKLYRELGFPRGRSHALPLATRCCSAFPSLTPSRTSRSRRSCTRSWRKSAASTRSSSRRGCVPSASSLYSPPTAGTEMNWAMFLRDAYDDNGVFKEKDPIVLFNEKLQRCECTIKMDA